MSISASGLGSFSKMDKLLNSCKIGIISIWIVVFLVTCGKSAPSSVSSTYTHDESAGLKKKRSADLMDILSNMLLDHSAGVGSDWPNYGNIFDNDYPMDDWMTTEIPQVDYGNIWSDYDDRYGGLKENVDPNPPDSLDYSCSEEENNDIVPFVESGYQYNNRPVSSDWNSNDGDFVVIKPDVEDTYGYRHDSDLEYGTKGGSVDVDWNRTPSHGHSEIEETLWRQFNKPQVDESIAPGTDKSTPPVANSKGGKFNIFTCLSGPPQLGPETKNIADDYLVLLIKKDHILGAKNKGSAPGNRNHQTGQGTSTTTTATPSKAEEKSPSTEKTAVVSTTLSIVHSNVTYPTVPHEETDSNKTIATEVPSLSATDTNFGMENPTSSTANTMTVVATESPSIITVHVPNTTTAAESPSTTTTPVRTSTNVVTTTTRRPYRTTSYTPRTTTARKTTEIRPSSTTTAKTTQSPPTFTITDPKVYVTKHPSPAAASTAETTESPPTFTTSTPKVSATGRPSSTFASTTETIKSPPTFTTSTPKVSATGRPSSTFASTTETIESPPTFTTSAPKVSVSGRPSSSSASTIEIPATTTSRIQSNNGPSSGYTIQSSSKTTFTTIVDTTSTMPNPTSSKLTEIPYSTTKTSDPAPDVVAESKYIATDGATIDFSKPTTEKNTITTVATIISTIGEAVAENTLSPTTTEIPSLSTAQIASDPEGKLENGQQYALLPPADVKTDGQTSNNLDDINGEEPSTIPPTTEESWTYVE